MNTKLFVMLLAALFVTIGTASAVGETFEDDQFTWVKADFDTTVSTYEDGDDIVWVIEMDGIDGHWSTGAKVILCDDEGIVQVGWDTVNGKLVPDENHMSVSGSANQDSYEIRISKEYLGGPCASFCWAVFTEASWPGNSNSPQNYFPADWAKWTSTNMYEDVVPGQCQEIPEFPTMVLPIAAILGLAFIMQRRKD
ncbi:hypothetical protein Mpsy_0729 [Methanolobus psychrophilus R15]|nr:hypothetical protein Mpsy_0729 [Methanolobus psychrophilus R15]